MSKKITDLTEQLVNQILETETEVMELVDIEFKKESSNWFLRVFIDKEGGVDIDDCGRVSEKLSQKLDEIDPITTPYILEVSSPGAERPLKNEKDILKSIGKHVHIKTYSAIDGNKIFEGKLLGFENEKITVEWDNKNIEIPYEKIAKIRLAIVF